jgi:hypothetical protein
MKRDSWLSMLLRWLSRSGASIANRLRPVEDTGTGIAGRCLTCCGTGKWYEGTPWEEPCVNCGGRGWGRVEPGGEAERVATRTEHAGTDCPRCKGTGVWLEGTSFAQPCVDCDGTGCDSSDPLPPDPTAPTNPSSTITH